MIGNFPHSSEKTEVLALIKPVSMYVHNWENDFPLFYCRGLQF